MLFRDKEVLQLISVAFANNKDIYLNPDFQPDWRDFLLLSGKVPFPVLIITPTPVFADCLPDGLCELSRQLLQNFPKIPDAPIYVADVKLLYAEETEQFLLKKPIPTVIIPFAECALLWEYGYKKSYTCLGELRSMLPYPMHVCALFSYAPITAFDTDFVLTVLSPDYIALGENRLFSPRVVQMLGQASVYYRLSDFYEKYSGKTTAVLFTTRRHADDFHAFCEKRGNKSVIVHGGISEQQNRLAVKKFIKRESDLLIGTKTALSSLWFTKADFVFYGGVPYSPADCQRLFSLTRRPDDGVLIGYCSENIIETTNITKAMSELLTGEEKDIFLRRRFQNINQMLNLLERSQSQ